MGPLVVVELHPGIDRLLGLGQTGRRADLGPTVTDPVVPQDLFEQHHMSARLGEAAGELHPVIGQNLGGQQVRKPSTSAAQTARPVA